MANTKHKIKLNKLYVNLDATSKSIRVSRNVEVFIPTKVTIKDYNLTLLVDTSSSDITIKLPRASCGLDIINIKKVDSANQLTIIPQSGETIDSNTFLTVSIANDSAQLTGYLKNWNII